MASEKNMGEMNSEELMNLSGDSSSTFVPKTISEILADVSMADDLPQKSLMLDFHVRLLEDEMRKVDAFKRQLPHSMHLLEHAIETLKKEKLQLKDKGKERTESDDWDGNGRVKGSIDISEKKSWMSSVQLWSTPVEYEDKFESKYYNSFLPFNSRYEEEDDNKEGGLGSNFTKMMRGGAFLPFKKPSSFNKELEIIKKAVPVPVAAEEPSLSIPTVADVASACVARRPHLHKKQRRCWSPELHKRFVDALIHLGGPLRATPKQIRELMKIDGLTNDEVKSHLQKYRLHIRKLPAAAAANWSWMAVKEKRLFEHSISPQDHLNQAGSSANGGSATRDDDDDDMEGTATWNNVQYENPMEHRV